MKVACCVRDRLIPPANLLRSDQVRWRLRAATMGGDVAVLLLAIRRRFTIGARRTRPIPRCVRGPCPPAAGRRVVVCEGRTPARRWTRGRLGLPAVAREASTRMSAHGARDVGQLSALAPAFRAGPHTEARRRPPVPGVAEKGVVRPCVKSQALGTLTQFKIRLNKV
jgi:hypothetical protein